MQSTTWEEWEAATVVAARDLQPGDQILAHPEAGPFGPWQVHQVRPTYGYTTRVDIVVHCDVWMSREDSQTYRVERVS